MITLKRTITIACAALALSGCSANSGEGTGENGDTLIAFASSFAQFRTWESFPVPATSTVATVHTSGPRTEYLNHEPAHGSKEFPVGTIIVKESEVGDIPERKVFAMVKRGGDYNVSGAANWEWFELVNVDEDSVVIVWRGVGPPAGETYGGDPNASCNSCHVGARSNDYVQSVALRLTNF